MEELFYGKKKAENMPSTPPPPSACDAEKKDYVLRELSKVYASVFRPIEEATKFDVFYSSLCVAPPALAPFRRARPRKPVG